MWNYRVFRLSKIQTQLCLMDCSATVGQVGNVGVNQKSLGRIGFKCWLVMYPVYHTHGTGEERAPISTWKKK